MVLEVTEGSLAQACELQAEKVLALSDRALEAAGAVLEALVDVV